MASFDPLHPLHSAIVEILAGRPGATVAALHRMLAAEGTDVSVPNLYRVVGQMTEAQMLVKAGGRLSLNLVWVSSIATFFDTVRERYLSGTASGELPTKEGKRREYHADSLAGLDPMWNDVLMKLIQVTKGGQWYEYASHPYFYLGIPETESRFYAGLRDRKVTCRVLHGNDTFLDLHGDKLVAMDGAKTAVDPNPPFPKEGYVLVVYGDYVMECVFPPDVAGHFAFFFETVRSMDGFDPQLFADVFRMKAKCKISVRKSAREAVMLGDKIAASFTRKPR